VTLVLDEITSKPMRRQVEFQSGADKERFCANAAIMNPIVVIREELNDKSSSRFGRRLMNYKKETDDDELAENPPRRKISLSRKRSGDDDGDLPVNSTAYLQFYVKQINNYGICETRIFSLNTSQNFLKLGGTEDNPMADNQQNQKKIKLLSIMDITAHAQGNDSQPAWEQAVVSIRYKGSSLAQRGKEFTLSLVFEEEELGALQEQLSQCSVKVPWKRSDEPLEVEQWERFDCIKVSRRGGGWGSLYRYAPPFLV
jgi:hypothetical protein